MLQNKSSTVRVITVSNLYGSGAIAIASLVAKELGFELIDEQLPVVVAKRLGTSASAVESAEALGKTMSERMLRSLELGTPELGAADPASFDEDCLREIRQAVRDYGAAGKVVLIGRGAHAILGRRPDLVRTFFHAPREWRIERVMQEHSVDTRTAAGEVDRIDRARRDYMKAYYSIEWTDPSNYDLSIDTSTFQIEEATAIVLAAVRSR